MEYLTEQAVEKLKMGKIPEREALAALIGSGEGPLRETLIRMADETRQRHYGKAVFLRGLIEFSNYCARNCMYCGIRGKNGKAERYRLQKNEILSCCEEGYRSGYRTFVLQSGEDPFYGNERMADIISSIKTSFPEAAVTLSIGEKSRSAYQAFFNAGADRYLLRHETASASLYDSVHENMHLRSRLDCLKALGEIGYQVGAGFMVGLPGQTDLDLADDLVFLAGLRPHMVGIGPFIPHPDTPLGDYPAGSMQKAVLMVALARLVLPRAMIPATTALGTIDSQGREKALRAGANVVMPNLSPPAVRSKYALYAGKFRPGEESAPCRAHIAEKIENAGYELDMSRGDHVDWRRRQ